MRQSRAALLSFACLFVGSLAVSGAAEGSPARSRDGRWVDTWTAMPQLTEPGNMPPAPFTGAGVVLADSTLRQTLQVAIGGQRLRVRFSNAFGDTPLVITAAHVALPVGGAAGVSAIQPGSDRAIAFQGRPGATIPPGSQIVSDPIDLELAPHANLTVTIYLATGQPSLNITSHPGSRTSSYMIAGNSVGAADLPGATRADHWYFLSAVEVRTTRFAAAVVVVGDSLTDGRGSTTNGNDRWPNQLARRLQSRSRTAGVAVVNQAAGGNRVLNDGLGPNAIGRIDRDVLAQSGVRWLILFEGVNDIGTAAATAAAQAQVADDLIAAYQQIIRRAHAHDILVYGATITPFVGSFYTDPDGFREAARQRVNAWIRTSGQFDAVIDFDVAARNPADPATLLPAFDTGDHLHLNPAGYQALADAVPADLFWHHWFPGRDWQLDSD